MALIRIDASGRGPVVHGSETPAEAALARGLARPGKGPVIVMVHGYRFLPGDPVHCPHLHILSDHATHPCRRAASWPRGLGIGQEERIGIAFGWPARGSIWEAYEAARRAGRSLARVIEAVQALAPGREIHAIGHSLGARVLLSMLAELRAPGPGRVLLLAGADHLSHLEVALASPAGRAARLLHVTSGENRLFDLGLGMLVGTGQPRDAVLGRRRHPGLPELRLDDARQLAALAGMGFALSGAPKRVCHWSSYLRQGTFPLYRALTGPQGASLHAEVTRRIAETCPAAAAGWLPALPWSANPSS